MREPLDLGRPPCGPPPGCRRPWEWEDAEPRTIREQRLARLPASYDAKMRAIDRARRTTREDQP